MRTGWVLLMAGLTGVPAVAAEHKAIEAHRLELADEVMEAAEAARGESIPRAILEHAECVGVFPAVARRAFLAGGEYGHGIFTCREHDGTMGAPAFFGMGGSSGGWPLAGQDADLVLLVMTKEGARHLLSGPFTLGAEVTAAIGPTGQTAQVAIDAPMHADILTWSRSRGSFHGVFLSGMAIAPDRRATRAFYGQPLPTRELLTEPSVPVPIPGAAQAFIKTVDSCTHHS